MKIVIDVDNNDYEFIKSVRSIMKNSDTFQRISADLFEAAKTRNCEHCVKTDRGLYCSHRDGRPKVTNGGWCIDMQEKVKKMDNDLRYYGNPMNCENVKGDLISRSALKKAIKSYADDQYAENEYLGECAIMNIIDNAPTVEYTFEEAFQKTVCEQRLYCPNKRPQGE